MKKIVVAVSGGVDSAVAALLVKQKGYNVVGAFMKNWDETDEKGLCSVEQDRSDAEYVCKKLNIPFLEINFVKKYWNYVFSYLIQEYENGFTPNPDILCNRHIKFNAFINFCTNELKADKVATGHYAKIDNNFFQTGHNETVRLLQPTDLFKDQTFFLSQINQDALKKAMFPLADLLKSDVKRIAKLYGLERVSRKKESIGICFIGKRNFQDFIRDYITPRPGIMMDISSGKIIGKHEGLHFFTVGQCSRIPGYSHRYFVAHKDVTGVIYVAPGTDHPSLFTRILYTEDAHWISGSPTTDSKILECEFRFQHTKPLVKCKLICLRNGLLVLLERPLRAITPGQFAVFYKGSECIGSSRIKCAGPSLFTLKENVSVDYQEYEHYSLNTRLI